MLSTSLPPNKPKLLIVDDDDSIRSQMRWALSRDYEVFEAGDRLSTLKIVDSEQPMVVLLDLGLPPKPREAEEGLQTLHEIMTRDLNIKVIMVTGNTERGNALKAVEMGAFDFFIKPPVMDEVHVVIKRALRMADLERENRALREEKKIEGLDDILGTCSPMQVVFQAIRKVATVDVPVLILGESGTGKELAARAIHRLSHRRNGPFVAINCGAIPETLLESELFGYEKGAFTGADTRKKGRIEYAEKGTLFLDEIGDMSLSLQVKLLRFLQEHIIERVGGREHIAIDVRVLAATNQDITKIVKGGHFREDLYFRLSVVTISMPPIRERNDDIYLLARSLLHRYQRDFKRDIRGFSEDAINALGSYPWPGNVRELENRLKRAVVMAEGDMITANDLELSATMSMENPSVSLKEARDKVEKDLVQKALLKHGGVIVRAAEDLGITRQTLADLIKKYGIGVK